MPLPQFQWTALGLLTQRLLPFRVGLVLAGLMFMARPCLSQGFLHADGTALVNGQGEPILLRGMGLGGWMVQEGYMLQTSAFANAQHEIEAAIQGSIGEEATAAFYDAWLHNHVQEADIEALHNWGFNMVRVPLHYNLFTLPIEDEPVPFENTWVDTGFELTDSLVQWCKERQMYVLLDLHAAPGGQGYNSAISDYNPNHPSLWESEENRAKTASLWKRIATHYSDEPWVAGYDLLNEPNWELPGGTALRALYQRCTDSIRTVDPHHTIFIEGNWFANDFTGLTPPWDGNMAYSPHKYWNFNDQASLQGFLDLRSTHNVPLFLGESGENSNVWFRDAIHLLEGLNVGWAWWPLKKVESISGVMSVAKPAGYDALLDHWEGTGPAPSSGEATAVLMELTENLKTSHCKINTDVIDAMMRQPQSNATLPFNGPHVAPAVLFASDYDLGRHGYAYWDNQVANYEVTTGEFTAWNNGWVYRNDGVDLEACSDTSASNGWCVGWAAEGEWLSYTVHVLYPGAYDLAVRVASPQGNGAFHLDLDGSLIAQSPTVPMTGGWDQWESLHMAGVNLPVGPHTFTIHIDAPGFNFSHFDFQLATLTSTGGCTYSEALNFDAQAGWDDGSCAFATSTCPADLDNDALVGAGDLLMVLAEFGMDCIPQ